MTRLGVRADPQPQAAGDAAASVARARPFLAKLHDRWDTLRRIADKYALLPDGTIVPLSRFFGVSGGVDGELRKLLESADGPMSDQCLTDWLREAGYPIARRTVAKHRARLGFTAAPLR